MPPLEAWEKVLISGDEGDAFFASSHGALDCMDCHGGAEGGSKEAAHEGLIRDPSENPRESCGGEGCHEAIVENARGSIHFLLSGMRAKVSARTACPVENDPNLAAGFETSCNKCHTTCGQCHVSRPLCVGGGFVAGHSFEATPSMINQCTACHGSRVGDEYRGKHKDEIPGYQFDIHYRKNSSLGGKHCVNCHSGDEMHNGMGDDRYAVAEMPRCEDCHSNVAASNAYHTEHWGELGCHVCHSQDYRNCNACHPPDGGLESPSYLTFKIGKNPLPHLRDYEYVVLRHVPIARDTYDGWGYTGGTPNYDDYPTWKYTSPHNIQRWTARTDTTGGQSCWEACHNSPATTEGFFLRQIDLDQLSDEAAANEPYIVPDGPVGEWGD
ncbi:MAG: hypothetical protein GF330_00380 [Candidatus Eisenbacteria bacterium]|nr:hypothetical protein [Candidatus Eisenbacteria bacterium]